MGDDGSVTLHNHVFNSYNAILPLSISKFLEKHEKEFFLKSSTVCVSSFIRKFTEDLKTSIPRSKIVDGLFEYFNCHASVQTLTECCEVAIDANGYPKCLQ